MFDNNHLFFQTVDLLISDTRFLLEKFLKENEPQKSQNLEKSPPKYSKNVKKISSFKCLGWNFWKRRYFLELFQSYKTE